MVCGKVLNLPVEKIVENFGSNSIEQFRFFVKLDDEELSCAKAENLPEKIFSEK